MHPFTHEKRRKINLGGATSVSSQTDLLHSAKARRTEREEVRRRHESALYIQSHWRSVQQSRVVKHILSEKFQQDVLGLNGMRALVLIGNNDALLAQWSEAVTRAGDGKPFIQPKNIPFPVAHVSQKISVLPFLSPLGLMGAVSLYLCGVHVFRPTNERFFLSLADWSLRYVSGPDLGHWIVLIKKIAILLLFSVANSPRCVPPSPVVCVLILIRFVFLQCPRFTPSFTGP
jgi:hypothetical protein